MADEESLTSKVVIDTSSAVPSVEALNQRLAILEAAFLKNYDASKKGGEGIKNAGDDAEKSGKKAKEASGFWANLAKTFKDIETHSRTAGMGLKQIGLDGDAAAARVAGLGTLFEGLGKATPMLLGVGAAVTAIGGAFMFVKDAADKAAEWQQHMSILGQTVKNQGGDWNRLSESVQRWAELQEKTTTYSKDEAVQALTQLTSTGMSLADAMKTTRVAEDAAAATGRSLSEINFSLMEAMHGRTQALTQLGLGTKEQIKQGMSYNQVLSLIEKNMSGAAAAAANTYSGKVSQLHNAFESLQETVGSAVLPILTKLASALVNLIQNAEDTFTRWRGALDKWSKEHQNIILFVKGLFEGLGGALRAVFDAVAGILSGFVHALGDVADFIANVFQGNWQGAWNDIKNFFFDVALRPMEDAFGNWGHNIITMWERVAQAILGVFGHISAAYNDLIHGQVGNIGKDLSGTFSGFGGITKGLNWKFSDAFSGAGSAFQAHHTAAPNLADTNTGVTGMVGGGTGHHGHHKKGPSAEAQHRKLIAEENKELKEKIAHIELEAKQHKITTDQEIKDLDQLLEHEKMTGQERQAIENKIIAIKHKQAAEAAKAEKKKQEAYKQSLDHLIKTLNEEVKEHKISHQQMADDLKKWVQAHKDADNQILQHAQDTITAQEDAQKKADEQAQARLEKQYKKWEEYYTKLEETANKWADKATGFVEGFFQKGKKGMSGFTEEWKKMIKDIEHALLKSLLAKLFMGALTGGHGGGPSFMQLFAANMGFGGPKGGSQGSSPFQAAANAGSTGAASGGVLGALIGTSNASSVAGALPTDSVMSMLLGIGFGGGSGGSSSGGGLGAIFGLLGGGGGGGGPSNSFLGLGGGAGSGVGGIGELLGSNLLSKGLGNILKGGLPGIMKALGFGQGSILGGTSGALSLRGAGIGALAGNLFAGLLFGNGDGSTHTTWGTIGGTLGGLFGGPIGGAIGGFVGSLFGHKDNPANMPDKYDTQRYGTIISDLIGHAGANGQNFNEQSELSSASGGLTGIQWVEETLAKYAKPGTTQMGSDVPDWLKPMWSQLVSAFGVSSSGSGQLNFGHAINNEWITGAQGVTNSSGSPMQYTDFGNLLDQFFQSYMTQGQLTVTNPNQPPTNTGGGFNVSSPFQGVYTIGADGKPVSTDTGLPPLNVLPPDNGHGLKTGPEPVVPHNDMAPSPGMGTTPIGVGGRGRIHLPIEVHHNFNINVEGGIVDGENFSSRLEEILSRHFENNNMTKFNPGFAGGGG